MLTKNVIDGLQSFGIQVKSWGSNQHRVQTVSANSNRLTWTATLTPRQLNYIAKKNKITIKQLEESFKVQHNTKMEIKRDSVKTTYMFTGYTEERFLTEIESILREQKSAFKANIARGFKFFNIRSNESEIFYASMGNTAIFERPIGIYKRKDIDSFLDSVNAFGLTKAPLAKSSSDKFESITEYHLAIYPLGYALGNTAASMPDTIKNDYNLMNPKIAYDKCIFACIGYHLLYTVDNKINIKSEQLATPAKEAFKKWCEFNKLEYSYALYKSTKAIDILQFDDLEKCFNIGIDCYKLDLESNKYVRIRDATVSDNTLALVLHDGHAVYVRSSNKLLHTYQCKKCEMLFETRKERENHTKNRCDETELITFVKEPTYYKPGQNRLKTFLERFNITDVDHYHDHLLTYDFETLLKPREVVTGTTTSITHDHIPVSVSIYSTLTDETIHLVNEDPKQLIIDMVDNLRDMSFDIHEYNENKFKTLTSKLDEVCKRPVGKKPPQAEQDCETVEKLLKSVPVVGFNSGSYDMNLIKDYLFGILMNTNGINSVIRAGNKYMCISTGVFKMMDVMCYVGPGTSLDKYIQSQGVICKCEVKKTCTCGKSKGSFPYEAFTSYDFLNETELPSKDKFESKLKNTVMSDEEYERMQWVWEHYEMKTVKDLLRWYNNLDVKPLAEAIKNQSNFYKRYDLDMFQDAVSLPGCAEKIMYKTAFNNLPEIDPSVVEPFEFPIERFNNYIKQDIKAGRTIDYKLYMTPKCVNHHLKNQQYKCNLCKKALSVETVSVDRLNNDKAHNWNNIHITHIACNIARKDMSIKQFQNKKFAEGHHDHIIYSIDEEQKEVYSMMKENIAGGPAIIYCRYAKAFETYVRSINHKGQNNEIAKLCRKIIGYDANALYLWALGNDMPCGRLTKEETYDGIVEDFQTGKVFGFLQCDIEVPEHLKEHFSEMAPIFKNVEINPTEEIIGSHMFNFNESRGKLASKAARKLIGSYFGTKILLYAPLLQWYLQHGLIITKTHCWVKAAKYAPFASFKDDITKARIAGDANEGDSVIAECMKLVGNSAFGRSGMDKSKHSEIKYVASNNEKKINSMTNHFTFKDKNDLNGCVEFSMKKRRIRQSNPIHLSIAIYQLAKLRMLEFYYDLVDKYMDRSDFEWLESDTDSAYIAFTDPKPFENCIKPGMMEQFLAEKDQWFPRTDTDENKRNDKRKPGLFKEEWTGGCMISLAAKNYICTIPDEGHKVKLSAKGVQKNKNAENLTLTKFESVVKNKTSIEACNRGFKINRKTNTMESYIQYKRGLSYYYDKRRVHGDGIHTFTLEL